MQIDIASNPPPALILAGDIFYLDIGEILSNLS